MSGEGSAPWRTAARCLPRARALAAEGTGPAGGRCGRIGFDRARLCYGGRVVPGCRSNDTQIFGRPIGVRFGLTRRCSAVSRVCPSAEDGTRASQPVIAGPARVLAVLSRACKREQRDNRPCRHASHEVSSPSADLGIRRAARCCHASDDPAPTIRPAAPLQHAAPAAKCRSASHDGSAPRGVVHAVFR
jgi:hypothetical protein